VWFLDYVLHKTSSIQSKGLNLEEKARIRGTIVKSGSARKMIDILLVDDLYQTGSTLTECVSVLRQDPYIRKIYVLTITKTKR
jgi:predicted amidophosphoribosyltransferase